MRRGAKFFGWIAGCLACAAALAVAVLPAATPFLNTPELHRKIEATLSRTMGGAVTFERARVTVFPAPSLVLERVNAAIPPLANASCASIGLSPRIVPLFRGKILLSRIRLHAPDLRIALHTARAKFKPGAISPRGAHEIVRRTLASLGPGVLLETDEGRAVLTAADRPVLKVINVNGRVAARPDAVSADIRGTADPGGGFFMSGRFAPEERTTLLDGLSLGLGQSKVTDLSARIEWGPVPRVFVRHGKASFALDEMFHWVSAAGTRWAVPPGIRSLRGRAELTSIRGSGPIASPKSWVGALNGRLQDVVVDTTLLPAPASLDGNFALNERGLSATGLSASVGGSSLSDAALRIAWKGRRLLRLRAGRAAVSLDDLSRWRNRLGWLVPKEAGPFGGTMRFSALRLSGPFSSPREWKVLAMGTMENVRVEASRLPGPLLLHRGAFEIASNVWSFSKVQAVFLDASLTLSGSLHRSDTAVDTASCTADGGIGGKTMQWLFQAGALPADWLVRTPVVLSGLHVVWRQPSFSLAGSARIADGPTLAAELITGPGTFELKRLTVSDGDSNAAFSARYSEDGLSVSFSGRLTQSALHAVFPSQPAGPGTIRGDLRANLAENAKQDMDMRGEIEIRHVAVVRGRALPLTIEQLRLEAYGQSADIENARVAVGDSHVSLSGGLSASGRDLTLDGQVSADVVDVSGLIEALSGSRGAEGTGEQVRKRPLVTFSGLVRTTAREVRYAGYRFSNVRGSTEFDPEGFRATFTQAKICGLSIAGTIASGREGRHVEMRAFAAGGRVDQSLDCLTKERVHMSGTFDLQADLRAADRGTGLLPGLAGRVSYQARDGEIYRYPLLAKILSIFSVTELLRGKVPQLGGSGFPYHTMTLDGTIENGRLKLEKAVIDGSSLTIIAQGEIDLTTRTADLVVLVAPFSTINWIIRHIPLVGRVLGGTLISIPAKVSGSLADPNVSFLAPSAVGSRIVTLLENVLKLPVEIVSPLIPKKDEKK